MSEIKFTDSDRKLIMDLAFRLTGSHPNTEARMESCFTNLSRRMMRFNTKSFVDYLAIVEGDRRELAALVSALTIHHTSWFREHPHFDRVKKNALEFAKEHQKNPRHPIYEVLSAGCSSGEEVYTLALVLESVRSVFPQFEYRVEGWDVDPISLENGRRCIYSASVLDSIPDEYRRFLLLGSGRTAGLFTLDKHIRDRCTFKQRSLVDHSIAGEKRFYTIFCRNVLIYFSSEKVGEIIRFLLTHLHPNGTLSLGHSESIEAKDFGLKSAGNACYQFPSGAPLTTPALKDKVRARPSIQRPDLILVGASTGGTEALIQLLHSLPRNSPPVLVVQHIAHSFARPFAERLSKAAGLSLGQPTRGSELKPHHLYMAWGDYHIGLKKRGEGEILDVSHDPPQHSVRPAVDFLFLQAAKLNNNRRILAFLLTGMGKDGALGLLRLREAGAITFTQDEKSSVVFGMPAEAVALGASMYSGSPEELRQHLLQALTAPHMTKVTA